MQGRVQFLEEMIEQIAAIIGEIEEREAVEPDLHIVRDLAEQLKEELDTLE